MWLSAVACAGRNQQRRRKPRDDNLLLVALLQRMIKINFLILDHVFCCFLLRPLFSELKVPPCLLASWSKEPSSTITPSSSTAIRLHRSIVVIRWAITMLVRSTMICSKAFCTFVCDYSSSAEVASSSKRILGFLTTARAIAIRCFWPPESLLPLAPHWIV